MTSLQFIKLISIILGTLSVSFIYSFKNTSHSQSLQLQNDLDCGFTDDFLAFLTQRNYSTYQFNRTDIKCGSYGGRKTSTQKIVKKPIIFIHGNSDVAFGRGTEDGYAQWQTGFRSLAAYFTASGYKKSQLYATTWGNANPELAANNYHSKENVTYLRKFVEAVFQYTKAPQIIVIGHSMGVTLGRKIIKGGQVIDHIAGNYSLGPSLHQKVRAFVGIAGGNYGLTACYAASADKYPTCNKVDGFYPGLMASSNPSTYLNELNVEGGSQGINVYTIWSKYDNVIGQQCIVWGKVTCRIPGQTKQIVKTQKEWNHFALRDNTGEDILQLIEGN